MILKGGGINVYQFRVVNHFLGYLGNSNQDIVVVMKTEGFEFKQMNGAYMVFEK